MAKKKVDWEAIEIAYRKGIDIITISKEYGVVRKTLQNRIYAKKWKLDENLGNVNNDVEELRQSLGKIDGHTQSDPILRNIVIDKIDTMLEDNEIIGNNRKLLSKFQSQVAKGFRDSEYDSAIDILNGIKSIVEIEKIVNPSKPSVTNISNTNAQQTIVIPTVEDMYD